VVDDLNLHGFLVSEEAGSIFEEVSGGDFYVWHKAKGFDGHGEHILANAFQINHKNHIVSLGEARGEVYPDFGLLFFGEATLLIGDAELLVLGAAIAWNSDGIVDVDLRCVGEVDGFGDEELIAHFSEVDDLVTESESWRHYMAAESEGEHLRAAFERKPERFGKFSKDIREEFDANKITNFFFDAKDAFILTEAKFGAERCFIGDKLPVAVDLACVLNADFKKFLTGHKDIADVHLSDRKLRLRAHALAREIETEALLGAGSVAESSAGILVWPLGTEGHTTCHFGVRPNFAFQRFNLENFVLEQHFVVINSLLDGLVLAGQSVQSLLLPAGDFALELIVVV